MSTKRISISGVDGTGKTTVIRRINQIYSDRFHDVFAIRAPQYHEDHRLPFSRLSAAIDRLSVMADQTQDASLKSTALFLSMTLYGDIEKHVTSAYQPKFLFTERQCLLDTLAYAQFYLPLLQEKAESDRELDKRTLLDLGFPAEGLSLIRSWLQVVQRRDPAVQFDEASFSFDAKRLFAGSPIDVIQRLSIVFHGNLPDQIILLTTSPECIRLRLKAKKNETPIEELHETAEALSQLNLALRQTAFLLKEAKPDLQIEEIATEDLSVEETVRKVLVCSTSSLK